MRIRLTVTAVVAGIALSTFAAPAAAQRKVHERFPAAPAGAVRIQNVAGGVKVMGWDRDSVVVTGMVHERPGELFKVYRGKDGVKIAVWEPAAEQVPPSQLEVMVPARSQVWVRTGSAWVWIGGITGSVDVASVGGGVEVTGSPREVFAESMSGEVVLETRSAVARARTMGSAIRVRGVIADLNATSVSGNIVVEGGVQRGRMESVEGDVRYIGDISRGASLDFVNHSGEVELLLPAAAAAAFIVSTHEGRLQNEFKVPVRNLGNKVKGSELHFTTGAAGATVNIRTFRGRVTIRVR